jgi:uncharacterized membrane protein
MNRRFAGQILRIVGLLIEMLGILAVALSSRKDDGGPASPAGLSTRQIWIVVGAGFAIWLVGSFLTYWPGRASADRKTASEDKKLLDL